MKLVIPCAHSKRLTYSGHPLVMGILNVTPDSFSDAGRYLDLDAAIAHGIQMEADGANIIDIGGESTRPGAKSVSLDEELRRVIPIIRNLSKLVRVPISIDTYKAEVARQAIDAGCSIINDVTAMQRDPAMAVVAARSKSSLILMHMRGDPKTMQGRPRYRDVVREALSFLGGAVKQAEESGVERSRILIDPGLGFGKTVEHNLTLMASLGHFTSFGQPVVIGPSRKSFIGKALNAKRADRLAGTLACIAMAERHGVHVVRVHDVKETVQFLRMIESFGESHEAVS